MRLMIAIEAKRRNAEGARLFEPLADTIALVEEPPVVLLVFKLVVGVAPKLVASPPELVASPPAVLVCSGVVAVCGVNVGVDIGSALVLGFALS